MRMMLERQDTSRVVKKRSLSSSHQAKSLYKVRDCVGKVLQLQVQHSDFVSPGGTLPRFRWAARISEIAFRVLDRVFYV